MKHLLLIVKISLTLCWAISFSKTLPATPKRSLQDTIAVVDSLILKMNTREKIGQMIIVYHAPESFLKKHAIGGTIIMQNMLKKPLQLQKEIAQIQKNFDIGIFTSIDQEGGFVNRLKRLKGYQVTPSAADFAQLEEAAQEMWIDSIASGMKYMGLNTNLAPVIDPSHDRNQVETLMGHRGRAYGHDYTSIVPPAEKFCSGLKAHGIVSTAKHFPGYDVASNSDHEIATSQAGTQDILRRAKTFRALSQCTPFIMMSSIRYPNFDDVPSVFSNKMVALAHSIAPEALIMTDDLWGAALRHYINPKAGKKYPNKSFKRLAQMAFLAGNDLFMITYPQKAPVIQEGIHFLINRFPNLNYQLNKSLRKILIQKARMGLIQALK